MEKFKYLAKTKICRLPKSPGVYAFKKGSRFLYIGKAKNIRSRVKNHQGEAVLRQAEHIGYIETGSEITALLLEAGLIKRYRPKYNVNWKDDKNYFYVKISRDKLPAVSVTHQPENVSRRSEKRSQYIIGPFIDGKSLKRTLEILRRVFPYYCQANHPKTMCPWCHLKLCPGPRSDKKDYLKNIRRLIAVLRGQNRSLLRKMKREMARAAGLYDFKKAAKIRDQIFSLENVLAHGPAISDNRLPYFESIEAYDISNIQGQEATGSLVILTNGKKDKSRYRKFRIKIQGKPNDVAMIKEVLARRLKHPEWPLADLILIDGGKAQLNAAKEIKNFSLRFQNSNLKPGIIALAKKKNELYIEGREKPILLKNFPRDTANIILQARDEAHRFAVSYHHKLRHKTLLGRK